MATETFKLNVEYAWKAIESWRWSDGGSQRDWNADNNWTTEKVEEGWSRSGPYYIVSVVISDQSRCSAAGYANNPFCGKCLRDAYGPLVSDREHLTHLRELWRWKLSGQLVKEVCRDVTAADFTKLQFEIAQYRSSQRCAKVLTYKSR